MKVIDLLLSAVVTAVILFNSAKALNSESLLDINEQLSGDNLLETIQEQPKSLLHIRERLKRSLVDTGFRKRRTVEVSDGFHAEVRIFLYISTLTH